MTQLTLFANVLIPVAVDRLFTYAVPPELCVSIQSGVRVSVSFGKRTVIGIVVTISPVSPIATPKPILDVLDADPVLSKELLELTRWVSEYYMASKGEVLKAVLP